MLKKKTRRSVGRAGRANTESTGDSPRTTKVSLQSTGTQTSVILSTKGPTVLTNPTGD